MSLSKNAEFLLNSRYCRKHESIDGLFNRVSVALCDGDDKFRVSLKNAMKNGYFLPASPTLRNAGIKNALLHPCHVLPIDDSIEDIMKCLANSATVFHHGGGVGFNASKLRPKGAGLSLGGTSSGVVSFLRLFDDLTDVVKQGGFRRGALMGVLNHNHPEIASFITSKLTGSLTNFNISILVDDEFMMKATTNNSDDVVLEFNGNHYENIKANDLFDQIVFSTYICGDPGLLFYDRLNRDNPLYPKIKIEATNPCGEVPLPPMTSCNLGSINLTKFVKKDGSFDFVKYSDYVVLGMRTLKNVNKIAWYPFKKMTKNMKEYDICGLGHFGLADALIMMGIRYDDYHAINFLDELSKPYVRITNEMGGDSFYKRSQAPTGSLSIIADCSAGIEPVFERNFERHLTVGVLSEVRELYKSKYCVTAHEIDPISHLKVQAKIQSFTDAGVSKTINLPHDASLDDIRKIYIRAWKSGCKGITVFRDQSKEGVFKKVKCSDDSCYL